MIHQFPIDVTRYPVRMRWFLGVGWMVILAKCTLVWWAMVHWQVPIHPAWIVVPTLLFAATATLVWITANDE